jgi:excisionase family DNA binding protein
VPIPDKTSGEPTEVPPQSGSGTLHHPAEVAVMIHRSVAWVYAELNSGRLKAVRVGRSRLVRAEDLDAYLAGDHNG